MTPYQITRVCATLLEPDKCLYWSSAEQTVGQYLAQVIFPEEYGSIINFFHSRNVASDYGKVYYLTIQESLVEPGTSQRRPGLHVDSPGRVKIKNQAEPGEELREGWGSGHRWEGHHWGEGNAHFADEIKSLENTEEEESEKFFVVYGGIFLASSVSNSSRAWNCEVAPEAVGRLGDIEYLRWALPGEGNVLKPGQLYWITERSHRVPN